MVLQVASHLAYVGVHGDVELSEGVGIPYPRQEKQLGRVDGAGADEYFAFTRDRFRRTAGGDLYSDCGAVLDQDAAHERRLHELKVRPPDRGPEVGTR